jgi:hypothetical protein
VGDRHKPTVLISKGECHNYDGGAEQSPDLVVYGSSVRYLTTMSERLTSFAKPPRTAYARARHVRCRDPRLPSRNGAVVVRSGQWGAKSASTLPCRAGIQRGPDALQASNAQQQIQPKHEDKKE